MNTVVAMEMDQATRLPFVSTAAGCAIVRKIAAIGGVCEFLTAQTGVIIDHDWLAEYPFG
jgi:hypothetical protein